MSLNRNLICSIPPAWQPENRRNLTYKALEGIAQPYGGPGIAGRHPPTPHTDFFAFIRLLKGIPKVQQSQFMGRHTAPLRQQLRAATPTQRLCLREAQYDMAWIALVQAGRLVQAFAFNDDFDPGYSVDGRRPLALKFTEPTAIAARQLMGLLSPYLELYEAGERYPRLHQISYLSRNGQRCGQSTYWSRWTEPLGELKDVPWIIDPCPQLFNEIVPRDGRLSTVLLGWAHEVARLALEFFCYTRGAWAKMLYAFLRLETGYFPLAFGFTHYDPVCQNLQLGVAALVLPRILQQYDRMVRKVRDGVEPGEALIERLEMKKKEAKEPAPPSEARLRHNQRMRARASVLSALGKRYQKVKKKDAGLASKYLAQLKDVQHRPLVVFEQLAALREELELDVSVEAELAIPVNTQTGDNPCH